MDKNDETSKEMQKELEELVKSKFGDKVKFVAQEVVMDPLERDEHDEDEQKLKIENFSFNYLPKDVYQYLNTFIIGQHEAKKTLSIAICDHYHQIKAQITGVASDAYAKQNVLMLGPTGVGKTYIIKKIAQLIGVPFSKADATKFTEAGYVGANVEDTVRDLVSQANGNIELAQFGIVYIDEADKLAGTRTINGRDVSGRGVQNGLLKLLEETEIDAKNPMDMMAQMGMMMGSKKKKQIINTKNILFIFSGAFVGLEDIIKKRLNLNSIGFVSDIGNHKIQNDIFAHATTKDLVTYGLEPELVGRLPVRVNCHELDETHLFSILKDSKESIIHQYTSAFKAYGIEVNFTDCALKEISAKAVEEKTGARSLMTIIEKALRDFKFELPSSEIKKLTVDKNLIDSPKKVLGSLLALYN